MYESTPPCYAINTCILYWLCFKQHGFINEDLIGCTHAKCRHAMTFGCRNIAFHIRCLPCNPHRSKWPKTFCGRCTYEVETKHTLDTVHYRIKELSLSHGHSLSKYFQELPLRSPQALSDAHSKFDLESIVSYTIPMNSVMTWSYTARYCTVIIQEWYIVNIVILDALHFCNM